MPAPSDCTPPGVFDLRRELGRAPTVEEYRATRGYAAEPHPDPEQKRVERAVRQYEETVGRSPSPTEIAEALTDEDVANGEYEGCSTELELAASDYIARAERVL